MRRCGICDRALDVPGDELSRDQGGDCLGCMREIDTWVGTIDRCDRDAELARLAERAATIKAGGLHRLITKIRSFLL